MSEKLPATTPELSPEDQEKLDNLDPEFINYGDLEGEQSPFAALSGAEEDLINNQDFYNYDTDNTPYETDTEQDEKNSKSPLDFEPIGEDGSFVVQRTSGDKESGWYIGSYILDHTTDDGVTEKWVKVQKHTDEGTLEKEVRVSDLKGWNTPPDDDIEKELEAEDLTVTSQEADEESQELKTEDSEEAEIGEITAEELKASEILSFSEQFRMMVRESASENVTATQSKLAEAKAFLGRPRTRMLERRLASAQKKYDRISKKQDGSRLNFVNRHRDRKAEEAYNKLQESIKALDIRKNVLKAREDSLTEKGNDRIESINRKKQELIEKKVEAETRKQIRLERRSRRKEKVAGETYKERENRVNLFNEEDNKRMRQLAIEALKRRN